MRLINPQDQLAFIEDDYFVTTARLLHKILQTSTSAVSPNKLSHFVNYLAAHVDALNTEERVVALLGVSKYLQNVPVAKVSTSSVQIGKKSSISASVASILGQEIEGLTGKASLHQKSAVVENINLKNEKGVLSGEFDSSKLKAGYYTLHLELTQGSHTYTVESNNSPNCVD